MSAVYNATVQGFYLSYYGRPADPAGLAFWTGQLAAAGGNLSSILNAFGTSAEATRRYGTGTDTSKIEAIYQQTFGRAADATGLAFYQTELAAGRITLIDISKRIIDGATGDDVTIRTNRLSAAQTFTDRLDTAAERAGYSGSGAEDAARSWITTVTKDAATVTAAVATVDSTITSLLPVTFSLTSSADTWTGGSGDDSVNGKSSNLGGTLQGTDKLDGGAGTDKATISMDVAFAGFTTGFMKAIETLELSNLGSTSREFNATGASGIKTVSIDATNGPITLAAVPTGLETISIKAQSGSTGGTAFSTAYVAGAAEQSGTSDSLKLLVDGVGTSATAPVTATLTDTEVVTVTATGTNFVNFGGTQLTTLKVDGSGKLTSTGASSLTSVDGSAAKGDLNLTLTSVTAVNSITSVKTGDGSDTIAVALEDLKANATLSGGAGTDTITLSNAETTGKTVAYVGTGIETLNVTSVAANGAITIAASAFDALKTVSIKGGGTSDTKAAITLASMGAKELTLNVLGSTATAATFTSDNSGATTVNFKADSTAAKAGTGVDSPVGNVTFSDASAVTVNVEAFVDVGGTGNTATDAKVTASKATSVTLNVASGKNSTATEVTDYSGEISAALATSFTVVGSGKLTAAVINAPKATTGSITNGSSAGTLTLTDGSKLTSLNVTSGAALTITNTAALSALQNLTIAANAGTTKFATNANFVKASSIALSGSGTASAVELGNLGQTTNSYDLTVTASGTLKGSATGSVDGVKIGNISVTAGKAVTLDLGTVTGSTNIGTIGADADNAAGNVTIKAMASGTATGITNGFTVGAITSTGSVNIDAKGAKATSIGAISANALVIDQSGVETAAYTLGDISVKSSASLTLNQLGEAKTINIASQSTSTSLSVTVNGGVNAETLNVTASNTGMTSVTLSGDLNAGTDKVTVTGSGATAKTISLSGLTNYDSSTIVGGAGADTIVGGSGADTIRAGAGANILTGGAGADVFFFNNGESVYTAINQITDLGSTDVIVFDTAAMSLVTRSSVDSGADAGTITGARATVSISSAGVATFTGTATGYDTLNEKIGALSAVMASGGGAGGNYALFSDSGKTYIILSDNAASVAGDAVIELVGIALPSTAPSAGSSTGITGIGS
jgi:hypothetical protein